MFDDHTKMREFIEIALNYSNEPPSYEPIALNEEVVPFPKEDDKNPLIEELKILVNKMQSHREDNENQDLATGVEMGIGRASEMIENLIRRYEN